MVYDPEPGLPDAEECDRVAGRWAEAWEEAFPDAGEMPAHWRRAVLEKLANGSAALVREVSPDLLRRWSAWRSASHPEHTLSVGSVVEYLRTRRVVAAARPVQSAAGTSPRPDPEQVRSAVEAMRRRQAERLAAFRRLPATEQAHWRTVADAKSRASGTEPTDDKIEATAALLWQLRTGAAG
jgi:hypothetical protein